ncbi:NADP-dependent oxidoreductase [Mucilaginibacter lutimaris]|uniref:NADP-dependent oxidoreductase n=1 Tax=Mucilaginibacter lutimaris TaxID=931629 RepID=A0ABW2ZEJ0_9SPHI
MENNQKKIYRAVRYDKFGGTDVLYIKEEILNAPKAGEVKINVRAASINPGESAIREGKMEKMFPSAFPSGQGSDFAGVVAEAGEGVKDFKPGDEVIGFSNDRNSQADTVIVSRDQLTFKPHSVPWEQAGSLFVVGGTAYAAVRSVTLKKGDILVLSAAAGGVGSVIVQLAKQIGVRVIGLAGKANHDWLKAQGAIPVEHGEGAEQGIIAALDGKKADALIDCFGSGYVELGIKLGIEPDRINTVIDFEAAKRFGTKTEGLSSASTAGVLTELAKMMAAGKLEIPVARTYPLTEVKAAYNELEKRHTHGKIVLIP